MFPDGTIMWSQGFGKIAYLKEDRSVTIYWGFAEGWPPQRIVHLSKATHWDPPHDSEVLTNVEIEELRVRLMAYHEAKNHRVFIR